MMRLPKRKKDAIKRWLYANDTTLWALGRSRSYVIAHLAGSVTLNREQLRMLVAVAPCVRWHGRGVNLFVAAESLSPEMWHRVDAGIFDEANSRTEPVNPLNPFTLARVLCEDHGVTISPRAVAASRGYARLVREGRAARQDGTCAGASVGVFKCE